MALPQGETPVQLISVPVDEYLELLNAQRLLECLKGCGVDNWCGWDDAYEMYEASFGE